MPRSSFAWAPPSTSQPYSRINTPVIELLERTPQGCDVPSFREKLRNGALLNTFLDAQFVVQKMIGKFPGSAIDKVEANAAAVAIGADQADLQIRLDGLPDGFRSWRHHWIGCSCVVAGLCPQTGQSPVTPALSVKPTS